MTILIPSSPTSLDYHFFDLWSCPVLRRIGFRGTPTRRHALHLTIAAPPSALSELTMVWEASTEPSIRFSTFEGGVWAMSGEHRRRTQSIFIMIRRQTGEQRRSRMQTRLVDGRQASLNSASLPDRTCVRARDMLSRRCQTLRGRLLARTRMRTRTRIGWSRSAQAERHGGLQNTLSRLYACGLAHIRALG